ncbi:MAG: BLUF domain-containing protein [Alphaproteobacteria bacterium]|nr:BLUF domain-containing protein [Alphaproteobacteria bacterium]
MFLTRLLYFSYCTTEKDMEIDQILQSARKYNAQNNITGALWFDGDIFVQVLEGDRRKVSETYHRIAADTRHRDIELVSCGTVDRRFFHEWRMGYYADTEANRSLVLKYSGEDKLVPWRLPEGALLQLLAAGQLTGS